MRSDYRTVGRNTHGKTAIRALVVTAVWLGAIGAAACSSSNDEGVGSTPSATATQSATPETTATQSTQSTATQSTTPEATATPNTPSARVSRAIRALQTAEKQVARGKAYDLETERYNGKQVWEVKVAAGNQRSYEFYVRADGEKIERRTRADERSDDAPKARISLADALRTAANRADGVLSEAEIDRTSSGTIVWTVTFNATRDSETDVILNAETGKVIRIVREDD